MSSLRIEPESSTAQEESNIKKKQEAEKYWSESAKRKLCKKLNYRRLTRICSGNGDSDAGCRGVAAAGCRLLSLSHRSVNKVIKLFQLIDEDASGKISLLEFMWWFGLSDEAFVKDYLSQVTFGDAFGGKSNEINLNTFVLLCLLICSDSKDQVMFRCFTLFDQDNSGFIDLSELKILTQSVASMVGGNFAGNTQLFLQKLDKDGDGVLSFDEFVNINRDYPIVFFPAFKLQDDMRKATLGLHEWRRLMKKYDREEICRSRTLEQNPLSVSSRLELLRAWLLEEKAEKNRASKE